MQKGAGGTSAGQAIEKTELNPLPNIVAESWVKSQVQSTAHVHNTVQANKDRPLPPAAA